MDRNLAKIFKNAKYEPESGLAVSVLQAIILREKRIIRLKTWAFSLVEIASLAGLVPTFEMLLRDLMHSGIYEYFSLLFSDGGMMLSYWKDFSLSIAESLPTTSIIAVLSLFLICFLSLKYLARQIIKNQLMGPEVLSLSM
jgi:hypothetical protein